MQEQNVALETEFFDAYLNNGTLEKFGEGGRSPFPALRPDGLVARVRLFS